MLSKLKGFFTSEKTIAAVRTTVLLTLGIGFLCGMLLMFNIALTTFVAWLAVISPGAAIAFCLFLMGIFIYSIFRPHTYTIHVPVVDEQVVAV